MNIPDKIVEWYYSNIVTPTIREFGVEHGLPIDNTNVLFELIRENTNIWIMSKDGSSYITQEQYKVLHDNEDYIIKTFNEFITPKDPNIANLLCIAQGMAGLL